MLAPLFNNLIVKVPDEKKETDGGIVLPGTHSTDRPQIGTVTAKGAEANSVEVGQDIVFRKYTPDIIELEGEKHYLLAETDVIAVIK